MDERRIHQRARPFIAALHTIREEKSTVPRTQVCFYPTLLQEEDTSTVTVTRFRTLLTRKRIWVSPNLLTRSRIYSFLISLGIRSERARLSGGVRLCAKMLDGAPVNLCSCFFRCLPSIQLYNCMVLSMAESYILTKPLNQIMDARVQARLDSLVQSPTF